MARVELTLAETLLAAYAGAMRQVENLKKDRTPYHGAGDKQDWQLHLEGCLGEMALAKHLNVFWSGKGGFRAPDVGELEVRTTRHENGRLILHPADSDDATFYLLTGVNGTYDVRGHILGRDGKREEFWADPTGQGRGAFFVPQSHLR